MNLNLITLNTTGRLDFDISPDMIGYTDERIIKIDSVHVRGTIIDNGTDDYQLSMTITGQITLKSAINSGPVPYKLDIKYDEFVENFVEIYKNSSNSLDILPIIWENILLEIPIRATNEDDSFELTAGDGWEILDAE
ncbi:MAG TPA: hypothetical protein DCY94_03480 [Firmicutes bacterium]|nr:hypothetical protein [Bacillota bacterium]